MPILSKDMSLLTECKIEDCGAGDKFYTTTFGNPSLCRIVGKDIFGDIDVKSTVGPSTFKLRKGTIVYRNKHLWERETFNVEDNPLMHI